MKYCFISGGQTGIDRGMLDACLEHDFPCGGWCPAGRLAEDGPLDARYPLQELPGAGYPERTRENVVDSDGTLILYRSELTGGTKKSKTIARSTGRPYLLLDFATLSLDEALDKAVEFVRKKDLRRINFSGPRGSAWSEAHAVAREFTGRLIERLRG